MTTTTETGLTLAELSPEAQARAIDKCAEDIGQDDWWRNAYEDANNCRLIIESFDLDRIEIDIKPSVDWEKTAMAIVRDHGETCETYKAAREFLTGLDTLRTVWQLAGEIHDYEDSDEEAELNEQIKQKLSAAYLKMLDEEYKYLTSIEAIKESIEANDWRFDEDGNMV